MTGAMGDCRDDKTTGTATDRPTDPDAAPNCPAPPAAESSRLFRGAGRDDKPVFSAED